MQRHKYGLARLSTQSPQLECKLMYSPLAAPNMVFYDECKSLRTGSRLNRVGVT